MDVALLVVYCVLGIFCIEVRKIQCTRLDGGCTINGTRVSCINTNLTYIPEMPDDVTTLLFYGNFLPNVTKATFVNVSDPERLYTLRFSNNSIRIITENALEDFTSLTTLDLSDNYIKNADLERLLGTLCPKKLSLGLNSMGPDFANEQTFSRLNQCEWTKLFLKNNKFVNVSRNVLQHFGNAREIRFDYDELIDIQMAYMGRLEILILNYNRLTAFPNFCNESLTTTSLVPKLLKLYMEANRIMEIRPNNFKCLTTLIHLEISGNSFYILPDDMLLNLPKLRVLSIMTNCGHDLKVEKFAFRSDSLEVMRFNSNGQAGSIFTSINDTFKYTPNLRILNLAYISMKYLPKSSLYGLFRPLHQLVKFSCYNCRINQDPYIIFSNKTNLTYINLNYNLIESVNNSLLTSEQRLKGLHLQGNRFVHLTESAFPIEVLNRLEQVDLSGNPFMCDCGLEWFINWLKTANKSQATLTNKYKCASPPDLAGRLLLDVSFSYFQCHPITTWMWALIIGLPTLVVITGIAFLLYRNRWNFKHFIYLVRKRRNYVPIEGGNFLYDAFVSYSQLDSDWVVNSLIPKLETEQNYNLCVHERDFQLGAYINDNIVNRIEESKRIILVLSDDFATSGWCTFELKVALTKQIEDEFEIIVVLLREIQGKNMNKSIKTLLEMTTYLEWTEDAVGQELFWNKLKDSMSIG